jgi:hypothetical protein
MIDPIQRSLLPIQNPAFATAFYSVSLFARDFNELRVREREEPRPGFASCNPADRILGAKSDIGLEASPLPLRVEGQVRTHNFALNNSGMALSRVAHLLRTVI